MSLMIKLAVVALLHLAFFVSYPDTGPAGNYYLAISFILWSGFTLFIGTAVRLVKFLSGPLGAVLSLALFALVAASLAYTMPQKDKTSVMEKLRKGSYPDRATLNTGMRRFGINLDKELDKGVKALEKQAGKAAKKI